MPSIEDNRRQWQTHYDWDGEGDEWSWRWGGADAQWYTSVLPRIHHLLPTGTLLEIGPGFGRWTERLRHHADRLIGVDLAERCIERCRDRFADDPRVELHVGDGRSLAAVADQSVDFAFSLDSLVHADQEVVTAYLGELRRVLKPTGSAFLHHSNLGRFRLYFALADRLPGGLRQRLYRRRWVDLDHWRGRDVTARKVAKAAQRAGLACVSQELIPWGLDRRPIDCFSLFVPAESAGKRRLERVIARDFLAETERAQRFGRLYGAADGASTAQT